MIIKMMHGCGAWETEMDHGLKVPERPIKIRN